MLGVCIIPTGVGAEIGGHNGDANVVAKLLASACDELIVHPNVVNASDLNEMTRNMLYVEGSMLDNFLEAKINLNRSKNNRILLVTNSPIPNETVNAVSAARITLGADIKILALDTPLKMTGYIKNNVACGEVDGWEELVKQVRGHFSEFDALAISTPIDVARETKLTYLRHGGINPWGGVEAMTSRVISEAIMKPSAHSPSCADDPKDVELYTFNEIVDPRMAPEVLSMTYLHCILKGLHKAPRVSRGTPRDDLNYTDVDFLVTPVGCVGRAHRACLHARIPIIAVKENKTCLNDEMPEQFIMVENYLEAVGVIHAIKEGLSLDVIRRPVPYTAII